MSDLGQGPPPPRLPCEALSLRGSACHERRPQSLREDAPRHTTPATSPPRGGGVSGSGPREGGWAGTPGGDGKWVCTALLRGSPVHGGWRRGGVASLADTQARVPGRGHRPACAVGPSASALLRCWLPLQPRPADALWERGWRVVGGAVPDTHQSAPGGPVAGTRTLLAFPASRPWRGRLGSRSQQGWSSSRRRTFYFPCTKNILLE